ncbi:unnamed protein product [Amoebophrya sp. A25]|nr:unnamed protein product [Amoebophrya sp. A25]|eukprot:GSA25T00004037001.1
MELYSWGRGTHGQLGINQSKNSPVPQLVLLPPRVLVKECAAGEVHSAAVTSDGVVYVWGAAENGALGLGASCTSGIIAEPSPIKQDAFFNRPAAKVKCGLAHTAVVNDEGAMFTFGAGWFGRLGLGTVDNVYFPRQVALPKKVIDMSLAAYHTLVIDEKRDLHVWGRDKCVCEPMDCPLPKKFTQLGDSTKIVQIACREGHSLAITDEGEVYVWGENASHQLALPKSLGRPHVQTPEQVSSFPGSVELLATGPSHSLAMMKNGDVFGWGDQSCGRLGLAAIAETRYVDAPLKVDPVWSSLEAMTRQNLGDGGAEEEDSDEAAEEAGGGDAKSKKSGSPKGKASEQEAEKDRMFDSLREGAAVKDFPTIQSLLKQEAESAKNANLLAAESSLRQDYDIFLKDILVNVAEMERKRMERLTDVDSSFKTTVRIMPHVKAPDVKAAGGAEGKGAAGLRKLTALLPQFEELVWSLQQQPAYLSELSLHIQNLEKEKIFYRFVLQSVYHELEDVRTKHLFMALLKLMIKQEVVACKDPNEVFQPDGSRVLHLFSEFSLQPYFREDIIHSVMDVTRKSGVGSLMVSLDRGVKELGQHFFLTKEEFMEAEQGGEHNKDAQELTVEFHANIEKFREYLQKEFLKWLSAQELPADIQKILFHALQTIKARRFTVQRDDITIPLELQICEPLARLYVLGILVPVMENLQEYGGKNQGLGNPAQLQVTQDASIKNNVKKLAIFLQKTIHKSFIEPAETLVSKIGRQVKPAILTFCKEQGTKTADDTDTLLTKDVFVSHYDCEEHYIQLSMMDMLSVIAMLWEHESKIGLTEEDYLVTELLPVFQDVISDSFLKRMKPHDLTYNFRMNSRFLLTNPSMVFCKTSKAPVPRRLSAETQAAGEEDTIEVVKSLPFPEDPNDPRAVLQDIFDAVPPLQSNTLKEMKSEFEELKKQYTNATPPDYELARKLDVGMGKIEELILADTGPADVCAHIVEQIVMRDRQRAYLENVDAGRRTIQEARAAYYQKMERAMVELQLLKRFCVDPKMPKQITNACYEASGARLNMNQIAAKIATLRTVEPDAIPDGCTFNAQKTLNLQQLISQKVLQSIADPVVDTLPEKSKKKKLMFTFSFNQVGGLDIVVVFNESKAKTILIRKITVPQAILRDLKKKAAAAGGERPTTTLGDGFLTLYLEAFDELQRKIALN